MEMWTSKLSNFLTFRHGKIGNYACAVIVMRVNSKGKKRKKKKDFEPPLMD